MPRTMLHKSSFNDIHTRLAGKVPINKAAAYFYYYRNNPYAKMIQNAKYNSRPKLARTLGSMMAKEIASDGFFDDIDVIVPVPLHILKQIRRGYNQSEEIARGISTVTGIPTEPKALKAKRHSTQTRRNAWSRWLNTQDIYSINSKVTLTAGHILLVDDVITTGATMLRCLEALHNTYPHATLSVACLGFTHGI